MKGKTALLLIVMLLCISFTAVVEAAPVIKSDSSSFDVTKGMYVLKGNVSVEVGNRLITAGEARVKVTSLEVWGEGGITLTQGEITFTGDSLYVNSMQDTAFIKGGVTFKRGDINITADEAEFNWKTKQGVFRNNVKIDDGEKHLETNSLVYNVEQNTYQLQ
ncbi:MAG: LptA/OstA family protein [Negativicutes bacterium]|nr:LptA/OstA family protein [Negativicutes bacterium]